MRILVLISVALMVTGCAKTRVRSIPDPKIVRIERWGQEYGFDNLIEIEWDTGEDYFDHVESSCDLINWKSIYSWRGTYPGDMQLFGTDTHDCDSVFFRLEMKQ